MSGHETEKGDSPAAACMMQAGLHWQLSQSLLHKAATGFKTVQFGETPASTNRCTSFYLLLPFQPVWLRSIGVYNNLTEVYLVARQRELLNCGEDAFCYRRRSLYDHKIGILSISFPSGGGTRTESVSAGKVALPYSPSYRVVRL